MAKPYDVTVMLQDNMAAHLARKTRQSLKLAVCHGVRDHRVNPFKINGLIFDILP